LIERPYGIRLLELFWYFSIVRIHLTKILAVYSKEAGMKHSISPHKLRHFLFTWLKKQGIEDALIQPFSGHESRKSLEIYSKLSIGDAQESYENAITKFPV
jgi:integrase/recombinase XerD